MSLISIPNTFSAGAVIVASQHNSNFSTIANVINGGLDNNNLTGSAGITYANLTLTGQIVNADLAGSIADTKLSQITTASKVSGTAITGLASLPAGAGVIPTANLPAISKAGNQLFTSSGTCTAPTGITQVYITGCGAGASGNGATSNSLTSGGGGGAWVINYPYTVVAGNSYTVTINAAGTGSTGDNNGADGGTSVFDSLTLNGGKKGATINAGGLGGLPAGGATGTNAPGDATLALPGGGSIRGGNGSAGSSSGGSGGGTPWGIGGAGTTTGPANATGYGAGGSGLGSSLPGSPHAGGNGTSGFIMVQY